MRLNFISEEHVGLFVVTLYLLTLYTLFLFCYLHKQPRTLPLAVRLLRALAAFVGALLGWLVVVMIILQGFVVVVSNFFADTSLGPHLTAMQEVVTWMFGTTFMLGAAYTLYYDEHVRVDVFYRLLSSTGRAWVNLLGTLVLLVPAMLTILWFGWDYVSASWKINESSNNDLPGLYVLKSMLIIMTVQMLIQAAVMVMESCLVIFGRLDDIPHPEHHKGGL